MVRPSLARGGDDIFGQELGMRDMRQARGALAAALVMALAACGGSDTIPTTPQPDIPPAPPVLLEDIRIPALPSPYYHFEYDVGGRLTIASFASGLTNYEVTYQGGRIAELRNDIIVNHDRLRYVYDGAGRVAAIEYIRPEGLVFTTIALTYDGPQLVGLERKRRLVDAFVTDKILLFSYHADGNLFELTEHRPTIEGLQEATTTVDRFEQYDDGINVDAFGLLHSEFFDHLVLLPEVHLQKGNPRRVTHTGDGPHYTVDYTYTYDAARRPVAKRGDVRFLTGPQAGQLFQTSAEFSYH
jgi:hypothetical protein